MTLVTMATWRSTPLANGGLSPSRYHPPSFTSTPRRPRRTSWADEAPPPRKNIPFANGSANGSVNQNGNAPETEEDCAAVYQARIWASQERQLYPLKEDLSDWITKTLELEHDVVTAENFLDALDNGVIVCRLARVIQQKAQKAVDAGIAKGPVPTIRARCWESAPRRSFYSRDNMDNYLSFCRQLGVHQNLLFESDGLVLHTSPRAVVLCLLEVGRIAAARYSVEPPGLVQLEREIAKQEVAPSSRSSRIRHSSSSSALSSIDAGNRWRPHSAERRSFGFDSSLRRAASDGVPSDGTEEEWASGSGEDLLDFSSGPDSGIGSGLDSGLCLGLSMTPLRRLQETPEPQPIPEPVTPPTPPHNSQPLDLDKKVQETARAVQQQCRCQETSCGSKIRVKKVGDGRYNIAGRNVFVRLLKGRHMMVRVGGGWDTLEHFLIRHDPCQIKVVRRGESPSLGSGSSVASSRSGSYLHIRAKYRSPPPEDHY